MRPLKDAEAVDVANAFVRIHKSLDELYGEWCGAVACRATASSSVRVASRRHVERVDHVRQLLPRGLDVARRNRLRNPL